MRGTPRHTPALAHAPLPRNSLERLATPQEMTQNDCPPCTAPSPGTDTRPLTVSQTRALLLAPSICHATPGYHTDRTLLKVNSPTKLSTLLGCRTKTLQAVQNNRRMHSICATVSVAWWCLSHPFTNTRAPSHTLSLTLSGRCGRSSSVRMVPRAYRQDLIPVSMYDKYPVGPSVRPIRTRFCSTMTNMIKVCSNMR